MAWGRFSLRGPFYTLYRIKVSSLAVVFSLMTTLRAPLLGLLLPQKHPLIFRYNSLKYICFFGFLDAPAGTVRPGFLDMFSNRCYIMYQELQKT